MNNYLLIHILLLLLSGPLVCSDDSLELVGPWDGFFVKVYMPHALQYASTCSWPFTLPDNHHDRLTTINHDDDGETLLINHSYVNKSSFQFCQNNGSSLRAGICSFSSSQPTSADFDEFNKAKNSCADRTACLRQLFKTRIPDEPNIVAEFLDPDKQQKASDVAKVLDLRDPRCRLVVLHGLSHAVIYPCKKIPAAQLKEITCTCSCSIS
jgi:hypothetical protein